MSAPPAALATYETLRAEVLGGQARPAGLAAVIYHGMLRGLAVILTDVALPAVSAPTAPSSDISPFDPDLLRLVANMVLQAQSQVNHVY
jgi:hypothetical protein